MDIVKKILGCSSLGKTIEKERGLGKKIVFCSGSFDVLHAGHALFFQKCKKFGDILIVALGSDRVIRDLKGPSRPINHENNRAFLLASMKDVDYVVIADEQLYPGKIHFKNAINQIKPNVYCLNEDDSAIKEKQQLCNELGIKLEFITREWSDFLNPTSSTQIINKIREK